MKTGRKSPFGEIIRKCLWQSRREIALAGLCVLGSTAVALALPWPLKLIFDTVLFGKPLPEGLAWASRVLEPGSVVSLAVLGACIVTLALLAASFAYSQLYVTSRIGFEITFRLRSALFAHLQQLSLSFHSRARSGELLSKMVSDTNTLKDIYSEYVLAFATHLLTVLGMCVVMLLIDTTLALIVMLSFPVLFGLLYVLLSRMRLSARSQRHRESELTSRLTEVLGAISLVQAFGRERYEVERFEEQSGHSKRESVRMARIEATVARLVEIVRAIGLATVLIFGGLQVLRGRMSPGDLLVFSSYIVDMYKPVRIMARLSARFSKASASAERIREVLETPIDIKDAPDAVDPPPLHGEITFEHVSFAYEPGKPILDDLTLTLPAGRFVALVGASGAGKSTLANLIIRLYDPASGRVLIDGIDIRRFRRESLRARIGVVLQTAMLFGASIRENIAYGRPDATAEDIEAAARAAAAHGFIVEMPGGYDAEIGESGGTISGGQRQRISLARALIKRPDILIMDEPTSAIDAESEARIRQALRTVQKDKTTLLIAHHLQSVRHADLIVVLSRGKVIEQGTHAELVARNGAYCELFQIGADEDAGLSAGTLAAS
jgi:ATP-binding cassette subfamily B protein